MTVKWNQTILAFRPFNETDTLKKKIALLKKNIFSHPEPTGYLTPLPKQRYDRKKHLSKLIDCALQTLIGQHVFHMLSPDTRFISCDFENTRNDISILGNFIAEENIVNICPKTLCLPVHIQVNALIHECLHAIHQQMEKRMLGQFENKNDTPLNLCDQFFLYFFDECAAQSGGQFAGLCFTPKEMKKVVGIRPIFYTPSYWTEYYTGCLEALKQEKNPLSFLNLKHTKEYYEIAREYYNLYPELRNARTVRRIHEGWKIFATALSAELEKSGPQKISSQSVFDGFERQIPHLVDRAVNIKF